MELVRRFPQGSAYWAAIADDDDLAAALVDSIDEDSRPPLHGWTDLRESLAQIETRLVVLTAKVTHDEDPQLPARPETALERVRRARVDASRNKLLGPLLGDRLTEN